MTDLATSEPRALAGLREVAGDFDAVLVDQFGVMHDGHQPYDGAVAALISLKQAGKVVVVLTNSGKRAARNAARIMRIGFPPESFSGLVSSGEVAWAGLRDGRFGPPFAPGARTALVGRDGERYGLDDLDLTFVTDPEQADILLIMGSDCPRTSLADYKRLLAPAASRSIPALCCNPDLTMLTGQGLQPSAGAIAALYAELGGSVTFVGKPHGAIYREAVHVAGVDGPRVLTIGDSLDHDVLGGARAGFRTALVRTGILADMEDADFAKALRTAPARPDFILPSLCW